MRPSRPAIHVFELPSFLPSSVPPSAPPFPSLPLSRVMNLDIWLMAYLFYSRSARETVHDPEKTHLPVRLKAVLDSWSHTGRAYIRRVASATSEVGNACLFLLSQGNNSIHVLGEAASTERCRPTWTKDSASIPHSLGIEIA